MQRVRYFIVTCCLFLSLMLASSALAANKLEFSMGTGMPESHATSVAFVNAMKELEQLTNGAMVGVLYPSNQLGGDVQMSQSLLDHALVMQYTTTANQISFVPELAIFDIPFQFKNRDEAEKVLFDKDFMDKMGKFYEKAGMKLLGLDAPGFRWLSANKPVRKLEDLKGLKIRTMENPYHIAFWRALGVAPTPLPNSERYTALQQGTVDGQENVMENAFTTRMYEVQGNFINTKHIAYIGPWAMDLQFWNNMSKEQQELFTKVLNKHRAIAVADQVAREGDSVRALSEQYKRTVLELDPGELERWGSIARPVAEKMVRDKLGNELLDLMNAIKAKP